MMNKLKTFWSKTNRWHRILLFFFLVESRLIPGGQIGFECNDPALSHSFTGDTINFKWLFAVTTLLPLIIVLLVERLQERSSSSKDQALRWYREYLFGLLLNVTVVQVLKLAVGSPRPHFFETCQPVEATTCKGSEYVERYSCTQAHWLQQSDKSFPSGHTSLAVHSAVFIYYYLQQRAMKDSAWVRGVQLASITGAAVCGVSRMTDHRHHWWDVLAGTILALPILYYTMYHSCGNFVCQIPREKQPEKCEAAREDSAKTTL